MHRWKETISSTFSSLLVKPYGRHLHTCKTRSNILNAIRNAMNHPHAMKDARCASITSETPLHRDRTNTEQRNRRFLTIVKAIYSKPWQDGRFHGGSRRCPQLFCCKFCAESDALGFGWVFSLVDEINTNYIK